MKKALNNLTIIIPAYNEEEGLAAVLTALVETGKTYGWKIILVDDASTDHTREIASKFEPSIKLIRHRQNSGYGAAIKSGIREADTEWVATCDADGQHRIEDLLLLAQRADDFDAAIGERSKNSHIDLIRLPGKFILRHVARIITGRKIKDFNCGLRVIRKEAMNKIMGLTCDRFSFSTSSLIALIHLNYSVAFVEVKAEKRSGKSTVRQFNDGYETALLMLRLITLFNPLRVFLPISLALIFLGVVYQVSMFFIEGVSIQKSALLLILSGLLGFFFALLQDQVSSLRREISGFSSQTKPPSQNA